MNKIPSYWNIYKNNKQNKTSTNNLDILNKIM